MAREINGNHDVQIWWHQTLDMPCGKCRGFIFDSEQRFAGDASVLHLHYIQLNYRAKLTDWLELGPGYRQTWILNVAERRWTRTYDPMLVVIFKHALGKWEMLVRNQLQYRIPQEPPNRWLERLRVELISPFKLGKIGLRPFVYDELFFLEGVGFMENRLATGLRFPIVSSLSGSMLYIMRRLLSNDVWLKQSVIQFFLTWKF